MSSPPKPILLFTGGYTSSLFTLAFDPAAGTLTKVHETTSAGEAPTWLVFSEDHKYLYVVDEWAGAPGGRFNEGSKAARDGTPAIHSFVVHADGSLEKQNSVPSYGDSGCHAVLTQDQPPYLLAANYHGQTVASIPILADGTLDPNVDRHQVINFDGHGKAGSHPTRQDKDHPHAVELDPTGRWVIVPDLGTDELKLVSVGEGQLAVVGVERLADGDGPRHVLWATSGDGQALVYIINELANSVSLYAFDEHKEAGATPQLRAVQTNVSILPPVPHSHQPDFSAWHAAELKLSPDHKLYLSNRAEGHAPLRGTKAGPADVIAQFDLDPATGQILVDSRKLHPSGGRAARHFSLSSESLAGVDGDFVAVALHDSDELVIFERKGWTVAARIEGVGRPACVLWA